MSELNQVILSAKENFERISDINFIKEAEFAMQALAANTTLLKVAQGNPASLKSAIINLSACNLTLNPVLKLAYLVPRGGKVCLDISYMGLEKLATDSGSITFTKSRIVRQSDEFKLRGIDKEPTHEFNPFATDRGDIIGAYNIAKTHDGDFLTEIMTIDEILDIRDRTEAYKSFKAGKSQSCPWTTDLEEMLKKTVTRRASKSWPKTDRLSQAINVLNEHDGINKNTIDVTPPKENQLELLSSKLKENNKTVEGLLSHLSEVYKTPLESLEDLNEKMVTYSIGLLTKKNEVTV